MNNNDPRHPAQTLSGPNKYLQLARQTKCPLSITFMDGTIIPSCIIMELDGSSLLVKTLDFDKEPMVGEELVITRAAIKQIGATLEKNHNR